jgi:recombination protein RecT
MANNQLSAQKPKFSMVIGSDKMQKLINQTLGDKKKAERYTAAIMSAVATNPALQECEASSIISGSLLAESLNLSHSPQLGRYYLVPFKDKKSGTTKAQFILGYKGYIELAVRSGQYKHINALPIKEGELVFYDPFNDEIKSKAIQDPDERENAKTIGYYAMFEYLNGFKKVIFWSKKQMIRHADRYSPAFSANATKGKYPKVSFEDFEAGRYDKNDEWLYSSFWYKDFDAMACKTMLRQLISKWGIMSADMQQAYVADSAIIDAHENGTFTANIPDASPTLPEPETPAKPEPESSGEISIDDL